MSLYADYLHELGGDSIIETADGFVTFRYLNGGKTVYIVDIYICPESRQTGKVVELVEHVVQIARAKGCSELLGTTKPSYKGSTFSLRCQFSYGMELKSSGDDWIITRKAI